MTYDGILANVYGSSIVPHVEFNKFFAIKKTGENYIWTLKKKDVLNEIDVYYFAIPNLAKAIERITNLAIGKGLIAKDENKRNETNKATIEKFVEMNNLDYLIEDIIRIYKTKGTVLVLYSEQLKKFVSIETNRLGIITQTKNGINVKNDINTIRIYADDINEYKYEDIDLLDNRIDAFLLRNTPSSVFAIPPLMFNQGVSKSIVAEINTYYLNKINECFEKNILMPATLGDTKEVLQANEINEITNKVNSFIQKPTQNVHTINKRIEKLKIEVASSDPEFWDKLTEKYAHHVVALTGIAITELLPAKEINRATREADYESMIQHTIQPLNTKISRLVNNMFQAWCERNEIMHFDITFENPNHKLNVELTTSDLIQMEKEGQITINELRRRLGLEDYTDEQIAERENKRKLALQTRTAPTKI